MKDKSETSYLAQSSQSEIGQEQVTPDPGTSQLYDAMFGFLAHSVEGANQVMIAWLAALGTASAAQSDEHLHLKKRS